MPKIVLHKVVCTTLAVMLSSYLSLLCLHSASLQCSLLCCRSAPERNWSAQDYRW